MTEKTDRFYVPSRPTIIEGFRALRAALEKVVEARGGGRSTRPGTTMGQSVFHSSIRISRNF
jgi:hypothetical protein